MFLSVKILLFPSEEDRGIIFQLLSMKFLGFFYLENSHSSGFDIWANADLHGVLLQNWIFFKVPYDSIVTEI